jgi:hypothetical protein
MLQPNGILGQPAQLKTSAFQSEPVLLGSSVSIQHQNKKCRSVLVMCKSYIFACLHNILVQTEEQRSRGAEEQRSNISMKDDSLHSTGSGLAL